MKVLGPVAVLGILVGAALLALALTDHGDKQSANAGTDLGPPPPCFASWEDAKAVGIRLPTPDGGHRIVLFAAGSTPTYGPPFDMTKRPPPAGFNSWNQVIDLWTEANALGLFQPGVPMPTPEFKGPPPLGCESWEAFLEWAQRNNIFWFSAKMPTPNTTPIELRRFDGPPPPCFPSVEEMIRWFQSHREGQPYVEPHLGSAPEPPFNCRSWEEFYQYMRRRFPDYVPTR